VTDEIIPSIIPEHSPVALAEDMLQTAKEPDAVGGFYMILFRDGEIKFDAAGNRNSDLIYALEKTKLMIIGAM